ncbi:hypothetical protein N7486_002240 [Penicillium sp. IBT 16267x]|nr:hypothetical protein N7486_002240 [Penicillium sp. IBT 16267x]
MVEDVAVPKHLLTTAKFNSPWELRKWEKSLPENDRVQLHLPQEGQKQSGISRSASLSALRGPRRPAAIRPRSNPPELYVWDEFSKRRRLTPPIETEKEPITPIKESPSSMHDVYEKAKLRGVALQRKHWVRVLFEASVYILLALFIYFVLVGMPLWKGAVWWLYWVVAHKFTVTGGWAILLGLAFLYAFCPLLILFEKDPPPATEHVHTDLEKNSSSAQNTAILIPCYKSAQIIGPTLEAALKLFPAENIFVIANGNSQAPLDDTEDVCRRFGVNHLWVPVGSKIVAQFAGCYAAKGFENVLLIDDDCALPPNFPLVSDRLKGQVKCVGYTIKSVGPGSSKGTYCQQAQESVEYKMSGIQRAFFGMLGSATFPHGAISLWNTEFLKQTFHEHPGYSVSEDWFFGDACRRLGGRVTMCTSVFVETETPSSVFFAGGRSRGGFGEMTIFQQRFKRWNFFFVIGMYYDMKYILTSWKLGWREFGAKLCVFQEVSYSPLQILNLKHQLTSFPSQVYETLIYLFAPFYFPITFVVRPSFSGILLGATIVMYIVNVLVFNEIHLRKKKERIDWKVLIFYYTVYKIVLTLINVFSCYWSLFKYARYFAKRHPKIIEDQEAIGVVLSLERDVESPTIPEEEDLVVTARPPQRADSQRAYKRLTLTRVEAPIGLDITMTQTHTTNQSYRSAI